MPRFIEKLYPVIFSFCSVIYCAMYKITSFDIPRFHDVLNSYVNMSSIIIGFLATMISILITSVDKTVMKKIRQFTGMNLLTSYINIAVISGLIVAIYSVGYSAVADKPDSPFWYLFLFWVFIATLFLTSTFRILQVMLRILTNIANESETDKSRKVMDSSQYNINVDKIER